MTKMTNAQWFLLIGILLLARGMTSTMLKKLPFTPAIIYLAVGILLGPMVLHVFYFDPFKQSALLETLTEIAVLISLFSAGLKMPIPVTLARWRTPLKLAWVSMTITVALVAAFAYYFLDFSPGASILLGAILAPTDPVLATDVQSRHTGDNDQLRFTLTSEAGMNDGAAFPFVMLGLGLLGLHQLGPYTWQWLVVDVLWATLAAIAIGIAAGAAMAHIGWKLRTQEPKHEILDDLAGLGLIALVYGLSVAAHAWGFLAVFFAAVALRQTELKLARAIGIKPSELNADVAVPTDPATIVGHAPIVSVSAESLVFKEHLERLSELMLVLLLGGMLLLNFWSLHAIALALFLFFVARPVSVYIGLLATNTTARLRAMFSWFGVRGIGSIYYLMYAIQHGLSETMARELIHYTLIVVTLSILMHGTSVKPLMRRFWRRNNR